MTAANYLGALYTYLYDLVWTWSTSSTIDNNLLYALNSVATNFDVSMCNDCKTISLPTDYDYIVVGAGTAGLKVAHSLAKCGRVLVIERGLYNNYEQKIVLGFPVPIYDLYPKLPSEAVTSLENFRQSLPGVISLANKSPRYLDYFILTSNSGPLLSNAPGRLDPQGVGVGGSSTANFMLATGYSQNFFDQLEAIGGPAWGYQQMTNRLNRVITQQGGFIDCRIHAKFNPINPIFEQIADLIVANPPASDAGIQVDNSYPQGQNNLLTTGAYWYLYPNDVRCDTASAYFPLYNAVMIGKACNGGAIYQCGNITLLTNTEVSKVVITNLVATGVSTPIGNFNAGKVVLSAGTPMTPQILQLSGIGDPMTLTKAMVTPIVCNPNVGQNFIVQYGPITIFKLNKPVGGPVGTTISLFFPKLEPGVKSRLTETIFEVDVPPGGTTDILVGVNWLVAPTTRGSINITGSQGRPEIVYNFFSDPQEVTWAYDLVTYLQKTLAPIATMISPTPAQMASTDSFISYLTTPSGLTISEHLVGTCSLGKVVDPCLRVYGVANLYVADLSVVPLEPDANTEAMALMVGQLFADLYC
jgi:choline dehydrogenase